MAAAGREVAGAAGAARAVGLGLLAAALAVAAVAVVSGPHAAPEPVLAAAAPQSCPPVRLPCTQRARCWRRAAHARLRACVRARLRACVPACLRACVPACPCACAMGARALAGRWSAPPLPCAALPPPRLLPPLGRPLTHTRSLYLSPPPPARPVCAVQPCVPHVFSSAEEALLMSDGKKGKLALPGGDSAVQEAMRAASDANGQMNALAPSASDRPASGGGADPFRPTRTVSAVIGHGGRPYVSQWDQMHGEAEAGAQMSARSSRAGVRAQGGAQAGLRSSSGTLGGSGNRGDGGGSTSGLSASGADARADDADDASGDVARAGSLTQALRSLSNRRLRAIVRLLLKSRAINKSGSSRGGVEELRVILDGSRKREQEKRRAEQAELVHIRHAMDELAYKASRRRRESEEYADAIAALSKRLGAGDVGGDDRSYLRDGERRGSLLSSRPARLDDLFERDSRSLGGEHDASSTDALLQLLGGGEDSGRRQDDRRRPGARAELKSESAAGAPSSIAAATHSLKSSNKAILEELAHLAAREPRHHTRS